MKQNINEELNYIKYLFGYKKGVVISEQETVPTNTTTPGTQGGDGCEPVFIVSDSFSAHKADHTKFVDPIMNKITELVKKNPNFQGGTVTDMKIIGGASNVDGGVATEFTLGNDYKTTNQVKNASEPKFAKNMDSAKNRATLAQNQIIPKLKEQFGLVFSSEPTIETHVINTGGKSDQTNQASGSQLQKGQVVIIQFTVCPKQSQSTSKEGDIPDTMPTLKVKEIPNQISGKISGGKITKLSEVTSIDQIPKEFILTGSYYCNGKNSLGSPGNPNTWQPQCRQLSSNQPRDQRIASWEIKFPKNFAGNPNTVPVTRWNIIWSGNKILNITSTNFNKIPKPAQEVLALLYQKQSTVENLKSMMRVASGGADTFWDKWIGPYYS